jgi:hypothetical protein
MGALVALNCLWVVPIAAYRLARRKLPARVYSITGVFLGLVVAPASMGLYSLYFLSSFTAPLGMVGLLVTLFHQPPGYHVAIWMGLIRPATVVEGRQDLYIDVLNGAVWALTYGALGALIDYLCNRKTKARSDQ